MIQAIRAHLPGALVHGAAAGLHLMITFGGDSGGRGVAVGDFAVGDFAGGGLAVGDFADVDLAVAALAAGVKVQPLSWHSQRPGPPGLVLGYAANSPSVITEGIATIARILHGLTR